MDKNKPGKCKNLVFDRHLIGASAGDDVPEGEHSQESLLQPILMTSLSTSEAASPARPISAAPAPISVSDNIGKSRSHFDKPLNTSTSRGHGGCARSRIGKRNDEPFLVKLYEEPQRLFMAKSEADILNGTLTDGRVQCTLWYQRLVLLVFL